MSRIKLDFIGFGEEVSKLNLAYDKVREVIFADECAPIHGGAIRGGKASFLEVTPHRYTDSLATAKGAQSGLAASSHSEAFFEWLDHG